MPIVLVVDDSEVDRRLVGGLLAKDLEWIVEFADSGQDALDQMKTTVPDVVITDLMMPEMDGMELVANVRVEYPQIPVILITGQGSESLAVDALAQGAASYVPKSQLSDKLLETVEQVLALEKADRSYGRLVECMTSVEYRFSLDNDPSLIPPLVDLLQQMLMGLHFCETTRRMHLGVALEEALLNAMLHGNLEMTAEQVQATRSQLRADVTSDIVKQRREQEPYASRRATVHAAIGRDKAVFVIRDEGPGFDTSTVPERGDPSTLETSAGRGLVLIRNFFDDIRYNEQGNELTMLAKR